MPGSGIFSTFGLSAEETWSTFVAPSNWLTFNSQTLAGKKTPLTAAALHGGIYNLGARRSVGKWSADGDIELDLYSQGMGLIFQNMLGAGASSEIESSGAYTQVFTPADTTGESCSLQFGIPSTNNTTIQAVSYTGCKMTSWALDIKAGDLAGFTTTWDSYKQDTSQDYTSPSYVADTTIFTAAECTLTFGGTASTTDNVTSISGGTAVTLGRSVSVKGTNKVDDSRYVLGSFYKKEQLINGFRTVMSDVVLDFNDLTTCYDLYTPDTPMCLELKFVGTSVIESGIYPTVDLIMPMCFLDADSFPVPGPEIISEKVTLNAYDDGTNNPVQISYITLDTEIV